MDLDARIGWGVIIYAMMDLAWAGMRTYGWTQSIVPYLFELLVLIIVCIWAGSHLKFRAWKDILPYSLGWALIALALDAIFAVPSQGWGLYSEWTTWVGYLLVALLPLLSIYFRKRLPTPHGPWET